MHACINKKELVREDPYTISNFRHPSEKLQLLAVKLDPNVIQYIRHPTKKVKRYAICKNPNTINFIKNKKSSDIEYALGLDPTVIRFIDSPKQAIQKNLIDKNPHLIQHFIPTILMQKYALDKSLDVLRYFTPSKEIYYHLVSRINDTFNKSDIVIAMDYLLNNAPAKLSDIHIRRVPSRFHHHIVKYHPYAIQSIKEPDLETQMEAVKHNVDLIDSINEPFFEVSKYVLSKNGMMLPKIKRQNTQLRQIAIKNTPCVLTQIANASEEEQLLAVSIDPNQLANIENPTDNVVQIAIEKDPYSIKHVKHPTYSESQYVVERLNTELLTSTTHRTLYYLIGLYPSLVKILGLYSNFMFTLLWIHAMAKDPSVIIGKTFDNKEIHDTLWDYALGKDYQMIQYMKNPTEEMCLKVLDSSIDAINFFTMRSEKIMKKLIDNDPFALGMLDEVPDDIQMYAVEKNPRVVRILNCPCAAALVVAFEKDPMLVTVIDPKFITDKMVETVINITPDVAKFYDYLPLDIQRNMIQKDPWNLEFINNPDESAVNYAIMSDYNTINAIEDPTLEMHFLAFQLNGNWPIDDILIHTVYPFFDLSIDI